MVFEQLFSVRWIERKEHAFFLGLFYTFIGFFSARIIFPEGTGLMAVAFTSILLIPSINALLKLEENVEIREKKLSIRLLLRDHKDIFKVYLFMFMGIFVAFLIIGLMTPYSSIWRLYGSQLSSAGMVGNALWVQSFFRLLLNNLLVFAVCFLLSLVYGAGSIIFLTWNASVWSVVIAYFIKLHYLDAQTLGLVSIVAILPHLITEGIAYISAAIAGGVVSKAALREKLFSKNFNHIMSDSVIILAAGFVLVIISCFVESYFFM